MTEELHIRTLKRARDQVKLWEREMQRNQMELQRLKDELDLAFTRGREIAENMADAKSHLADLELSADQ